MKNFLKQFIKTDSLKPSKNDSLCLYPFFNLMITANGKYKPCCKWSEVLTHQGKELQAPEHSLSDAWSSDELKSLRTAFLNGEKPRKCEVCWSEEKSGIRSMRFDSFNYKLNKSILKSPKPIRLDIYPSNICNLRCRICSPHYSNRWIKEAKETMGLEEEVHLNLCPENESDIDKWLPNIVELGLFGGEPLFSKQCIALMEKCVTLGYSKNITLLITTNGTVFSDDLIQLFKSFKKVLLNFSIDDIGKRFEYQRKDADWDTVVKNMDEYIKHGGFSHNDQIECKICCTVSVFNAYYLPEFLEFINEKWLGMSVFLNVLHGPYALSLRNLPLRLKDKIIQKIASNKDAIQLKFKKNETRDLDNIIEFIKQKPQIPVDTYLEEIERGDRFRNESFEIIFPELHKIISKTV